MSSAVRSSRAPLRGPLRAARAPWGTPRGRRRSAAHLDARPLEHGTVVRHGGVGTQQTLENVEGPLDPAVARPLLCVLAQDTDEPCGLCAPAVVTRFRLRSSMVSASFFFGALRP